MVPSPLGSSAISFTAPEVSRGACIGPIRPRRATYLELPPRRRILGRVSAVGGRGPGCRLVGGAAAVYGVQRRRRFVRCGVWTGCTECGLKAFGRRGKMENSILVETEEGRNERDCLTGT
jgi:hypothetical protein